MPFRWERNRSISRVQRHLKNWKLLGYEYEKYSYLLMSKYPMPHLDGNIRIISRPNYTKHSVSFDICSEKNQSCSCHKER